MGPAFYIAAFLGTILGSGIASWKVAERYNRKHATSQVTNIRKLGEALLRIEKEQERQANLFLRYFQAIEEIRRRLGNGDRQWLDLLGGK